MEKIIIEGKHVLYSSYKLEEDSSFQEILSSERLKKFLRDQDPETIIVLWGDGSILEAIQENYMKQKIFLGINFWNKGFLLNEASILDEKKSFEVRTYPLLEIHAGEKLCAVALNEFDIKAWDGKMLDLDLRVWDTHRLSLLWDGIIVSTPIGSTWYNSSLWWPILPHNLRSYILTPKAPWKPKGLAPIILSDDEKLVIQTQGRQSPIEIYADGRLIEKYDHENISLTLSKSAISVKLLTSCEESCSWDSRVLEEQGFSKKEN